MKTRKLFLVASAAVSLFAATALGADRSYASGYFMLELAGTPTGFLHSIDGGAVMGEVVTFTDGADLVSKKHIGNVKYEEVTMQIGPSMAKSVYDWISDTLDSKHTRKNGAIVAADFNYRAQERGEFQDALITEITLPACDAASKDAAYLTVKFAPETLKWTPAKETKTKLDTRKQKAWLVANYRFNIPGLESSRVTKIEAFTIKQKVSEFSEGSFRDVTLVPAKLEIPNLRVTLPAAHAETWLAWSEDFLVKGNNGDGQEKEGTLTFLTPDMSEELVKVTFHHIGVSRVQRSLSSSRTPTITFDLYVEGMEIDFMAQFEKPAPGQ